MSSTRSTISVFSAIVILLLLPTDVYVSAFHFLPPKIPLVRSHIQSNGPKNKLPVNAVTSSGVMSMWMQRDRDCSVVAPRSTIASSRLRMANSPESPNEGGLDSQALIKYALAIGMQMSFITLYFYLMDMVNLVIPLNIPLPLVGLFFFFMSLRSRFFSPLDTRRPDLAELSSDGKTRGFRDRIMPRWTPPGVFFPIMWILIIAPLRAYASTLIFQANGNCFCDATILTFMLHLSIGDTWNTINNVERRMGAAVIGVYLVFASALLASYQYYELVPLAGKLIGLTCLWLATASALVTQTWRLNPLEGGNKDKLYPVKGVAITRFIFESTE